MPSTTLKRARAAAVSGFPAPMYRPTKLLAATEKPVAGMNDIRIHDKQIHPAVSDASPNRPTSTVMKSDQQTISLPHCKALGHPSRITSRMGFHCGRHVDRVSYLACIDGPRNTSKGTMNSTETPITVPHAAPATLIGSNQGTPGKPSSGKPTSPKISMYETTTLTMFPHTTDNVTTSGRKVPKKN